MGKGKRITFCLITFLVLAGKVFGGEYAFVKPLEGKRDVDDFFDEIGLPDVRLKEYCSNDSCWYYIVNHKGKRVGPGYNAEYNTLIDKGRSRFKGKALLLIKRFYKVGREYRQDLFLIDHRGKRILFNTSLPEDVIYIKPLINNNILVITKTALYEISPKGVVFKASLPAKVEYAYGGNNPEGVVSVVAVSGNDLLFISYRRDKTVYVTDKSALATHGDRTGILSIYPESSDLSYSAIYRYVNPYNKGLMFYKVDFAEGKIIKGFLFNSEKRNVGFDPSIFATSTAVIVSAKDSTNKKHVHFVIPKSKIAQIQGVVPEHIRGFEEENFVEFIVSAKASLLTWNAYSEVKKGDYTYAKVKYDMNYSLFYGTSLEGRIGETQIAITYLQNRAEEEGGVSAETSRILSAVIDFHGLVGERNTLRIGYEQGKINGKAEFSGSSGLSRTTVFETDLKTFYAYLMRERGLYYGLEFLNYKIPSAVGFSDSSGSVVVYGFDRDFTLNSLLAVVGYDHVSYAKRYETNFNSFYFAGNVGLGLGLAKVSSYLKERAKEVSGAGDVQIPLYLVAKGYGEVGYLFQRRAKVLKGFGFSFNFGYRATLMFAGAGSEGGGDPNTLRLEFRRYDLLHGPFLQASLIF